VLLLLLLLLPLLLMVIMMLMMLVVKGTQRFGVPLLNVRRPRITALWRRSPRLDRTVGGMADSQGVPGSELHGLVPGWFRDDRRPTASVCRQTPIVVVLVDVLVVAGATGVWLPQIQRDGRSLSIYHS